MQVNNFPGNKQLRFSWPFRGFSCRGLKKILLILRTHSIYFFLIKSNLMLKNKFVRYQSCFHLSWLQTLDELQTVKCPLWHPPATPPPRQTSPPPAAPHKLVQLNGKESIYRKPSILAVSRTVTVFLYQAQNSFIFVTWYSTMGNTVLLGSNFPY